jgi:cellulose synthase/poly-beta-1,6-N-acetylglucosamine synthase-like glycosyltransferase
MEPLISVIMPAYNSEYTIERAIESVLAQTYTRFELLVIDDYSMQRLSKDMSSTKPLPMKTMHCGLTWLNREKLCVVSMKFLQAMPMAEDRQTNSKPLRIAGLSIDSLRIFQLLKHHIICFFTR